MEVNDRYVHIENVHKSFGGSAGTEVLRDVSLTVRKGEFVTIIGHSGCGKSTLLNIVAGLTAATSGNVFVDSREVVEPGPDRAVVFQNHSLLPWLSVYQNVRLAVDKIFGDAMKKAERHEWTLRNLELVSMAEARSKKPAEISGGMKQRVGIARALSMKPKLLLLDEPFGALDALTRAHLQDRVMQISMDLGNTVMMITHDVEEAVLLSDRIVMLTNGPAATIGSIREVPLDRPRLRLELISDPTYVSCRAAVLEFLHKRHRFVDAA
jgi:nitrate/nitrite transport system ATP-binding protein